MYFHERLWRLIWELQKQNKFNQRHHFDQTKSALPILKLEQLNFLCRWDTHSHGRLKTFLTVWKIPKQKWHKKFHEYLYDSLCVSPRIFYNLFQWTSLQNHYDSIPCAPCPLLHRIGCFVLKLICSHFSRDSLGFWDSL